MLSEWSVDLNRLTLFIWTISQARIKATRAAVSTFKGRHAAGPAAPQYNIDVATLKGTRGRRRSGEAAASSRNSTPRSSSSDQGSPRLRLKQRAAARADGAQPEGKQRVSIQDGRRTSRDRRTSEEEGARHGDALALALTTVSLYKFDDILQVWLFHCL